MQSPVRITFRHASRSIALEARIREHAQNLDRVHDRIIDCRVVVDGSSAHGKHEGKQSNGHGPYSVHVEITLPGGVINATNSPHSHVAFGDAYAALGEAFDNAKRQLMDFTSMNG